MRMNPKGQKLLLLSLSFKLTPVKEIIAGNSIS